MSAVDFSELADAPDPFCWSVSSLPADRQEIVRAELLEIAKRFDERMEKVKNRPATLPGGLKCGRTWEASADRARRRHERSLAQRRALVDAINSACRRLEIGHSSELVAVAMLPKLLKIVRRQVAA